MVYTLGEMLLDVIVEKEVPRERYIEYGHPGGAMLNSAISLARSGVKTALISETGDDAIARYLIDFLKKNNVGTNFIRQYSNIESSVALARLDTQKKAHYTFIKNYPAHRSLLLPQQFQASDMLLFGSLYALDPDIRSEIKHLLEKATKAGTLIIYDPNIRKAEQLTDSRQRKALMENFQMAHIIKGSDEDFDAVFGNQSSHQHTLSLQQINPEALIFITMGKNGALAFHNNQKIEKEALKISMVSTIGAGDGFNAGIAAEIVRSRIPSAQLPNHMEKLIESGIRYSAAVCQSKDNYIPKR